MLSTRLDTFDEACLVKQMLIVLVSKNLSNDSEQLNTKTNTNSEIANLPHELVERIGRTGPTSASS